MKKVVSAILAMTTAVALAACSSPAPATTAAPAATQAAAPAATQAAAPETTAAAAAPSKVYKWDWCMTGSKTLMTEIAMDMVEEIKEATNGQLDITIRLAGEMPYAVSEYLQATSDGSIAMADCLLSAISGDLSSGALIALPMLIENFDDLNTALAVLDEKINSELSAFDTTMVSYYAFPGQQVWGKGDVPASIADLNGMKVRAQGAEQSAWLEMNGLIPITVNASEVTTSVSRGIIDGIVTAKQSMVGENWWEVVDWGYLCSMQYIGVYTCVNNDMLNELPDDVRATFLEIADKYRTEVYPQRVNDYDLQMQTELVDLGLELVTPPEGERAAQIEMCKEYWAKWCAEKGGDTAADLDAILAALGK